MKAPPRCPVVTYSHSMSERTIPASHQQRVANRKRGVLRAAEPRRPDRNYAATVITMQADRHRTVVLAVPCFNEAKRLPLACLTELADAGIGLVLVNDGSTDATRTMIESWAVGRRLVTVVELAENVGKGEAVRRGLLKALDGDVGWVGFVDADFATPPSEVVRLIELARDKPHVNVVLGARVAMLGRDISRSAFRHYTGRVFATLASAVLGWAVYDTQCGAKLFRSTDALARSLAEPFSSRWAFDVELLGRLARSGTPTQAFWEEPLWCWREVGDSRRTVRASVRACAELVTVAARLRRWR